MSCEVDACKLREIHDLFQEIIGEVNNKQNLHSVIYECNKILRPTHFAAFVLRYEIDSFNTVWCHWNDRTVTQGGQFSSRAEAQAWVDYQNTNIEIQIKEVQND